MRWTLTLTALDLIDIAIVAAMVFLVVSGWRRIPIRVIARVLLAGALVYLSAQVLGLRLTMLVFNLSIVLVGLTLAIVYHVEIRRTLDRVVAQLTRRVVRPRGRDGRGGSGSPDTAPMWAEQIASAVTEMAATKTGALIVVRGRDPIEGHLAGGTPLDAIVTEPLLLSVFNPDSAGHDGALVVDEGRAVGFRHHLPLSADHAQLERRGTRHAAALGLAERSDALAIVVSEERGTISVARDGQLRRLVDVDDLRRELDDFLRTHGRTGAAEGTPRSAVRLKHGAVSVVVASLLWFFLVHESAIEYRSYVVPIEFVGVESGRRVIATNPPTAKVILSGPRRAFYFVRATSVGLRVPLFDFDVGEHEIILTASEVDRPASLEFANIFPRQIRFVIAESDGS